MSWENIVRAALHNDMAKSRTGGIIMIVVGFIFAPILIGVPVMIFGFYRLFTAKEWI